jgi:hypothetical protein
MSGETRRSESSWTTDSLKEYIEQRFMDADKTVQAALVAQEKAVAAALTAAKEAVDKANTAGEKRFDAVNEFRGQLADQTATLMPRMEYAAQHKALEDRVAELTDRVNRAEGSSRGVDKSWGVFVAIVGIAIAAVSLILAFVAR